MRKMASSGSCRRRMAFSSRAERRSRPKGFSTTIRAPREIPAPASPSTTVANIEGGMAR
jgi:hypothetical protein